MSMPSETPLLTPTVLKVTSSLIERIRSGEYQENDWLPAERDLASEFGVSRIIIRSALRELEAQNYIVCKAHHRPRVRSAGPHRHQRIARTSHTLGLWIYPDPSWQGSALIIRGIQETLGHDWRLVLGSPTDLSKNAIVQAERRFLQQVLQDGDIEGLILNYQGGESNLSMLEQIRNTALPMVLLDSLPPSCFEVDYVGVDNRRAMERNVRHLLELGHKRIAYVSNYDSISTVQERLEGYRCALQNAGIDLDPDLIMQDPGPAGEDAREGCESLVKQLLNLPSPPTAIAALNDITAFRVIHALRLSGLQVPADVSVTGFDGIERWLPCTPTLTTAYQPFTRIGAEAVQLLRRRLREGENTPFSHVILQTRLLAHTSTRNICTTQPL